MNGTFCLSLNVASTLRNSNLTKCLCLILNPDFFMRPNMSHIHLKGPEKMSHCKIIQKKCNLIVYSFEDYDIYSFISLQKFEMCSQKTHKTIKFAENYDVHLINLLLTYLKDLLDCEIKLSLCLRSFKLSS